MDEDDMAMDAVRYSYKILARNNFFGAGVSVPNYYYAGGDQTHSREYSSDHLPPGEYHAHYDIDRDNPITGTNYIVQYDAVDNIINFLKGKRMFVNMITESADSELAAELEKRRAQKKLEEKLALVEQYGEDTLANGTILSFDKQFDKSGKVYHYAALKTNNEWFITGERGLFGLTRGSWDQFVLGLVKGNYPVSAEEVAIADGFSPLLDSDAASYTEDALPDPSRTQTLPIVDPREQNPTSHDWRGEH